jgi:Ca2+-binding EF-hand superfamily protein
MSEETPMSRFLVFLSTAILTSVSFAQEQSADFARGGMHFSAKAMDTNGDAMISNDEFMKYHAAMWEQMTTDSNGNMTLSDASAAFARGGMHIDVNKMDPNKDGTISKDEFMKYEATHWSLLPRDASGQISVTDLEKAMKQHRKTAAAAAAAAKSD